MLSALCALHVQSVCYLLLHVQFVLDPLVLLGVVGLPQSTQLTICRVVLVLQSGELPVGTVGTELMRWRILSVGLVGSKLTT